ncbi:conserved hypothetical protein [Roseibium sp. TrichSKD4]|nr:conserved hypothetical protein [Roseibium sp. TrichSKD4]
MGLPLPDLRPGDEVPCGLYFNLDEKIYHADPTAKGSSALKAIAIDPVEWKFDDLYEEDKDTDALLFGSALHARMLEGQDVFNAKFCQRFSLTTDGMLVTDQDLKDFLVEHGQSAVSRGNKAERIKRVLEIAPEQKIFDVVKETYDRENEGKIQLKPRLWGQIEIACRWVQQDPTLSAVMENGTFVDGAPEVSIFYEDRGPDGDQTPVRLKGRLDRLLRHAIIDLKTFAPRTKGDIYQLALKTIDSMRYDLQEAAYQRCWQIAKAAHEGGTLDIYGDEPFEGFLDECFDRDKPKWIWVMVKRTGAPQPLVLDWTPHFAKAAAASRIEEAIRTYRSKRDEYGDAQEWPAANPPFEVTDDDLPTWFGR